MDLHDWLATKSVNVIMWDNEDDESDDETETNSALLGPNSMMKVTNLPMDHFFSNLLENFDILFKQKKLE